MTNVDRLIDELIGREGGFVDDPADRGGPTRWGITEQVARAYGYNGDMRQLARATAVEIYRKRYWSGPRFDEVATIYPRVAAELLDTGVNMGPVVAARMLQRGLNLLNDQARAYPDIGVDGAVGPMTIAALRQYKARRGARGEDVLIKILDGLQVSRYAEITEARPANERFFFGWIDHRIGQA
ncbi:hypothetical protein GVO57_07500 [Sphingomonas changnyeongensis]|uniref:Peptidoglycan binding protein n=1 Tax=Sphingomonas changnyeongensis TaxID=2698679 RepID=A0A7Z2NVV3_9SPHN|nr:N-acetylmuramidase [Sphingomonas changnyeongensis]QHL90710.1 hypothetical protein GVO57_07500 [Sphingomonas changnyeongensis]